MVKVRVFPSEDALLRRVSAVLVEIDEKWATDTKASIKNQMPGCVTRSQQNFQTSGCSIGFLFALSLAWRLFRPYRIEKNSLIKKQSRSATKSRKNYAVGKSRFLQRPGTPSMAFHGVAVATISKVSHASNVGHFVFDFFGFFGGLVGPEGLEPPTKAL